MNFFCNLLALGEINNFFYFSQDKLDDNSADMRENEDDIALWTRLTMTSLSSQPKQPVTERRKRGRPRKIDQTLCK